MITLDEREVFLTGERLTLPITIPLPVTRGHLEVCLATAKGGEAVHPTLARTVTVDNGKAQAFSVFARDVRSLWPRGGPCWLVIRYADTVLATGALRVVVG